MLQQLYSTLLTGPLCKVTVHQRLTALAQDCLSVNSVERCVHCLAVAIMSCLCHENPQHKFASRFAWAVGTPEHFIETVQHLAK